MAEPSPSLAETPAPQADSAALQPLGELLVERGLIDEADRNRALTVQSQIGGRLGAILIRIGAIGEDGLLPVLSEQLGMPIRSAEELPDDMRALARWLDGTGIARDWWLDQGVVAWEDVDGVVWASSRDPLDQSVVETLERAVAGHPVNWCLIASQSLERLLERLASVLDQGGGPTDDVAQLRELAEEAPVIEFVNNLIAQAAEQGASDIHIEPHERNMVARYRIDGVLYTRATLSLERLNATVSRIKLISGMDIAERRLPQDGRVRTRVAGEQLDIRVSSIPGLRGESMVLRLLPAETRQLDLDSLGLALDHEKLFANWIDQPHGILLVTGPTGSGKSTTLYAGLEAINDGRKKIITVEDPVEYQIDGITQIQVQSDIDYTFANALRAILRHDPDVVLVGEIRDLETAQIAVRASLTGHLVLSTLHTNDAVSAFTRLVDMGIEPYLVASPVRGVMAQRLVRRLCPDCAVPAAPVPDLVAAAREALPSHVADTEPRWLEAGSGCSACRGFGYRGRVAIHELVQVTPQMQHQIVAGTGEDGLREAARSDGARSLREDGLVKAWQGITSVDEVLRVTAA